MDNRKKNRFERQKMHNIGVMSSRQRRTSVFLYNSIGANSKGFTLIELIVSLIIGMLVGYSALAFFVMINLRVQQRYHRRHQWDEIYEIRQQIMTDLYRCEGIRINTGRRIEILDDSGNIHNYRLRVGVLYRDQKPLNHCISTIDECHFLLVTDRSRSHLFELSDTNAAAVPDTFSIHQIDVELYCKIGNQIKGYHACVALRNPIVKSSDE